MCGGDRVEICMGKGWRCAWGRGGDVHHKANIENELSVKTAN